MPLVVIQFIQGINHNQCIPRERMSESTPFLIILQERATTRVSCMIYFVCFAARILTIDDRAAVNY
jgi:hypothetical protein